MRSRQFDTLISDHNGEKCGVRAGLGFSKI
jgi:hypothetical protein